MRLWTQALALVLVLVLGACAQTTPLEGGWQSNRELTLAELRQSRTFTPEQLEKLSRPDFFGHMVQIYRGDQILTVFQGECSQPQKFEILESDARSIAIRYFDEESGGERELRLDLDGERLYVPFSIAKTDLREVFTRVPLTDIAHRHPCTRAFTGE